MDRDQLAEHLRFASELGVAGVSRDSAWREKGVGSLFQDVSSGMEAMKKTPDPFIRLSPVEGLAAVRAEIGDCTRCKLRSVRRTDSISCSVVRFSFSAALSKLAACNLCCLCAQKPVGLNSKATPKKLTLIDDAYSSR